MLRGGPARQRGSAGGHGSAMAALLGGKGAAAGGALSLAAGGPLSAGLRPPLRPALPGTFLWALPPELPLGRRSPPLRWTLRALVGVRGRLPAPLCRWLFLARHSCKRCPEFPSEVAAPAPVSPREGRGLLCPALPSPAGGWGPCGGPDRCRKGRWKRFARLSRENDAECP